MKNVRRIAGCSQVMSANLKSRVERPILSLEDCPGGLLTGLRRGQTERRKVKP